MLFEDFACTDGMYGITIWARRVNMLNGHVIVRRGFDGRFNFNESGSAGVGSIAGPCIRIDQVYAGNFHVTLNQTKATSGIHIGDDTLDYFPRDWNFRNNTVIMDGYNPRTSTFPTTRTALRIEKMEGGSVHFIQIEGNIILDAGCLLVDIIVQPNYLTNYTVTANAASTYRLLGHDGTLLQRNAGVVDGVSAGLTAGTTQTQAGGLALTKKYNEVATVANANDTVVMPLATGDGDVVTIVNNGANTLRIYPGVGDNIGTGVDTLDTLTSGSNVSYRDYDATNWESV